MSKCRTCKINEEAKREGGCCIWYMDNVVCGDKSVEECPQYDEIFPILKDDPMKIDADKLIEFFKSCKEKYGSSKHLTWDQLIHVVNLFKSNEIDNKENKV